MHCPKCGHQNNDLADICTSCGYYFTDPNYDLPKPKISKTAILSLILGISSLFFFVLTSIYGLILGILSIMIIRNSEEELKGKAIAKAGIIISILFPCLFYLLWRMDTPPISDDYTIADFRSAPADCAASYELLKTLLDPNNNLIERTINLNTSGTGLLQNERDAITSINGIIEDNNAEEISRILNENADIINHTWTSIEEARKIIHQLDEFPEIADLYVPSFNLQSLKLVNVSILCHVYYAYANLQTEPEDIDYITDELITLDSVLRKLNLNARSVVMKLVCLSALSRDISIANSLINKPGISQDSLDKLEKHFTPLSAEQLSLTNVMLCEYFSYKDALANYDSYELGTKLWKQLGAIKINSSLRMYRNYFNDLIQLYESDDTLNKERVSVWPWFYPFKEPVFYPATRPVLPEEYRQMPPLYSIYNPMGTKLLSMLSFNIERIYNGALANIKTRMQMFRIVFNMRLGREIVPEEYPDAAGYTIGIDNKYISAPGPDRLKDTRDDIKLPINPEVLGLRP